MEEGKVLNNKKYKSFYRNMHANQLIDRSEVN